MAMNFRNDLNEKQFEAVTTSSKFNRIIAGAGSGKTRVLTYRLAYLLKERGLDPFSLLAITFTNKAAKEMKERTISLLPELDLRNLQISTFHSFCNYLLRREIRVLGFPPSFSILDESDTKLLLKNCAEDLGYEKSGPIFDYAYRFIGSCKTKGQLPGDIKEDFLNDLSKQALNLFKEYEKRKNAQFSLDFDDLLIYTVLILSSYPEIKAKYNNRFKEILVDEFQDTNDLQFRLLTLLSGENTGIYVVGDPDQTIYTWRGANQRVILDFDKYFRPLNTIILNENYRSTSSILNVANTLIDKNKERVKKDLFTQNGKGNEVICHEELNDVSEANWVIKKIKDLQKIKNVKLKDVVILYRSSFISKTFEKALMENRISYKVYGGLKFYDRKEIKDALAYFYLLLNDLDDISFLRIINVPRRGIGDTSISIIKKEARDENLSLYKYIKDIFKYESMLSPRAKNSLTSLVNIVEDYKVRVNDKNLSFSETLDSYLKKLGYYDYLIQDDDSEGERIANVKTLIEDIRSYLKDNPTSTLDEYLQNITLLTSQDAIIDDENTLTLMTVHTAKGLEFDYVFVVGFTDTTFPSFKSVSEGGTKGLEEERRLAYVAFTRARKELYITYNKGYSYATKTAHLPSRFIKESGINNIDSLFERDLRRYDSSSTIYKINFSSKEPSRKVSEGRNSTVISFNVNNETKWKVGDLLTHDAFGDGKVIEVDGDIIIVDFENFGIKKMLGSHHMLHKKG